jgi:hypothetical protein
LLPHKRARGDIPIPAATGQAVNETAAKAAKKRLTAGLMSIMNKQKLPDIREE